MDTHRSQPRPQARLLTAIDRQIYDMLAERRRGDNNEEDVLAMLLATRYEDTGEGMTDEQLHNEISAMLFAGHDTTSNALTWTSTCWPAPPVEVRLHAELDAVLAGRTPTIMDLPNLPYTYRCLEESMRLYPPAWTLMGRTALEEDEIGGYHIPSGSSVMIFPYVTHRAPRFWQRPDRFIRNLRARRVQERPRFAYMPFGSRPGSALAAISP